MTWARLCDTLHGHQKAHEAGLEAMGLWAMCASWCGQQLSDGFVPTYIVAMYGGPRGEELAKRLVEARAGHAHGLWEEVGTDGWWFHDWLVNNPSRAEVLAERERWAQKKRRQRDNKPMSLGESLGVSPGDSKGESDGESRGVSWKGRDSSSLGNSPFQDSRGESPGDRGRRPKPPWCGYCEETTRLTEDPVMSTEDKTVFIRCPICHPDVPARSSRIPTDKGAPPPVPEHQRAANRDPDEATEGGALRARLAAKRDQTETP